jgi:hypothetical protein
MASSRPSMLRRGAALATALAAALAAAPSPASAGHINTGDPTGSYHADLCPLLSSQLRLAGRDYACAASSGTRENMGRVAADPRQLGYAHLDVFLLESRLGDAMPFTLVRQDDVRVCLFAVTRKKDVSSWKEIGAQAGNLRFVLPPEASDSATTFSFLRAIDPEGLGRATSVTYAASETEAIRQALGADDAVSLVVHLPDPDGASLVLARSLGGRVLPVIDRTILRQALDDRKIYFPQEVEVESASWTRSARKLVTACTPLVVFTGSPERIADGLARKDQHGLIHTATALETHKLMPEASMLGQALKRTRELSASGAEPVLDLAEDVRAKAKPYTDKAAEKAREAGDQAKRAAGQASEAAQKAYSEALRLGRELTGQAKPEPPKQD